MRWGSALHLGLPLAVAALSLACTTGDGENLFDEGSSSPTFTTSGNESASGSEAEAGSQGEGEAEASGDGDGETTSGDGDGDTTATTDPTTAGDGDGDTTATTDPTTSGDGDGDGDTTATTDPTTTTSGDGDGDGDIGCKKVDLLFVIDDSGSMSDQQNKLTEAFPDFMALVDQELVVDKDIDYRVGVVSTDMAGSGHCLLGGLLCGQGHRGDLQHGPDRLNCSDVPAGKWIETGPVATVSAQFTCIASMDGGEFAEQPLEAARAALYDSTYNAGFIRTDALLVIVIVTDEDDQSVWEVGPGMGELFWPGLSSSPVSDYWDSFVQLKGAAERVVIVGLHGEQNDDCPPGAEDPVVANAPRLHELQSLAAPNAYWSDLCDEDFTAPLAAALDVIETSCANFPVPQ